MCCGVCRFGKIFDSCDMQGALSPLLSWSLCREGGFGRRRGAMFMHAAVVDVEAGQRSRTEVRLVRRRFFRKETSFRQEGEPGGHKAGRKRLKEKPAPVRWGAGRACGMRQGVREADCRCCRLPLPAIRWKRFLPALPRPDGRTSCLWLHRASASPRRE